MKLTTEQIDQLYAFTRQHFVKWYDLQSELVDHLANAIEEEWEQDPNRSFEEILNKEFQKFGVFGFMDVVEEKQKFLNKKYARLLWSYYKDFFSFPKIILSVALLFGLHTINHLFEDSYVFPILVGFLVVISIGFTLRKRMYFKQRVKETGKKWLLEDNMFQRVYLLIFTLPSTIINLSILFTNNFEPSEWSLIIGETAFVLVGLLIYIQLIIIPERVAQDLAKTYPEYYLKKA